MNPQKEVKYMVIKIDDLRHISVRQRRQLDSILEQIKIIRRKQKRPDDNKYIICNQNEPYAEEVWQTILHGEQMKEDREKEKIAAEELEQRQQYACDVAAEKADKMDDTEYNMDV